MIVVIDNYDSFVHNLARYIRLTGQETRVIRNDDMTVDQILSLDPAGIVISPGPCTPQDAGISTDLVLAAHQSIPVLGVCLGHQCIGAAFGAEIARAKHPMHGLSSVITHDGLGVFAGVPNPLTVGRYHSLIVKLQNQPILKVSATSAEGEIMALTHPDYPVYGVQFHPESILTDHGQQLVENFVRHCV